MPRPQWRGSLSFGLVNVPVILHSAVRDRGVHFHQLHEPDGSPVSTRRVCATENIEVPWEEIAKGYELQDGRWVLLSDEDLQAAAPRQSRTIDIERFVRAEEIDPIYYVHPYLITPREEGAARAYALLHQTMRACDTVALGRLVMRGRERLVAIRSRDDALTLCTMRFEDEVRSSEPIAEEINAARPTRKQVDQAVAVIEELSMVFEPQRYQDEHRAHLEQVVARKRKGEKIFAPSQPEESATAAPDLMGALEQSLAEIRAKTGSQKGRRRRVSTEQVERQRS